MTAARGRFRLFMAEPKFKTVEKHETVSIVLLTTSRGQIQSPEQITHPIAGLQNKHETALRSIQGSYNLWHTEFRINWLTDRC